MKLVDDKFIIEKLKAERRVLEDLIQEIYRVAKDHDTGERQYRMTDYEYILNRCEAYWRDK